MVDKKKLIEMLKGRMFPEYSEPRKWINMGISEAIFIIEKAQAEPAPVRTAYVMFGGTNDAMQKHNEEHFSKEEIERLKTEHTEKWKAAEVALSRGAKALSILENPARDMVERVAAIHAMIGYCQSLEVGTVITKEYMNRMNSYYIPNLLAVMGDASICKGEELYGHGPESGVATPSPATSSEISVIDYTAMSFFELTEALGMNGRKWAEAFCQHTNYGDLGTAMTWFCNAVTAGYDEAVRRSVALSNVPPVIAPPVSVMISLKTATKNFTEAFGNVSEHMRNVVIVKEVLDAAGVLYVD